METTSDVTGRFVGLFLALSVVPLAAVAEEGGTPVYGEIERLRAAIGDQEKELNRQRVQLEALQKLLADSTVMPVPADALGRQRGTGDEGAAGTQSTVGNQKRKEKRRPEITVISDVGGVLTPRGKLVIEPQFEYIHASTRRFFFSGVEIVDAVLIGAIEAEDASRDTLTGAFAARYGITNRLEADVRVPYVYRDDNERDPVGGGDRGVTGDGIGDIEFGLHYQMNSGLNGWPFFIANTRVKTTTGKGPFDVDYDIEGRQKDLPTGSGFWSVEPSVTVIYPSDPVVLFGNLGYMVNFGDDVSKTVAGTVYQHVDPGDVVKLAFGMGIGLNRAISLSLGYEHDFVLGTKTETSVQTVKSEHLQVGSFLMGFSLRTSQRSSFNINLSIGATSDAPDVQMTVRAPFAL